MNVGKKEQSSTELQPSHQDDLVKSGLTDQTIKEAGIESLSPAALRAEVGYPLLGIEGAYRIPYNDEFCRYKLIYPVNVSGMAKYFQKEGTGNRLYMPRKAREALSDSSTPIYITEGEKKALKACQEGLTCVAVSGIWNWSDGHKKLIPDFDAINLKDRQVYIVPDNDWELPRKGDGSDLKQAVELLAERLLERGAMVSIVELPKGTGKVGLDDYLIDHSVEELKALPMQQVAMPAKATPNAKKKKELKETVRTAHFDGLVDLVADSQGKPAFLIKVGDDLVIEPKWELEDQWYVPPAKVPFMLPAGHKVQEWYGKGDDCLYQDSISFFKRFSYLPDNVWPVVATWVFLTYQQDNDDINYLPYVMFYALPERGKSRTGKAMTWVAYRGIVSNQIREASFLRWASDLNASVFLDVMDFWDEARKNNAKDILLSRFEKGHKVSRVLRPEAGAHEDTTYYEVFGPTVVATNKPVHDILETRCLQITMPNAPRNNYEDVVESRGIEFKERFTAWRARNYKMSLPEVKPMDGITGRLWDVSKPMLQIIKAVHEEDFDVLVEFLKRAERDKIEEKGLTVEGTIIESIRSILQRGYIEQVVLLSQILEKVNNARQDEYRMSASGLGARLKAMGMKRRHVHGRSEFVVRRAEFRKLLQEYGFEGSESEEKAV